MLILVEIIWDIRQKRKSHEGKYRLNDALTNISCGILDQVSGIFSKILVIGAYVIAFELAGEFRSWSIPSSGFWWALTFIAVDFAYYWSHRISHSVNLFWLGHVVHHQSEDYNLSVALRQGLLQKVFMFWIYLPLAFLGFPPEWFVLCMAFNLLYQFWIHTEVIDKMGAFEAVMNTPSHHRVHHGRNPEYIDKNHAGVFIIWDRMFGTFAQETIRPTYGITAPTESFNPIIAHTKPFVQLAHEVSTVSGFMDKLRMVFMPPGWYPASMGGVKPPPPITGDEVKYNRTIPKNLNVYIIVQYIIVLGITSGFLFTFQEYNTNLQVAFAAAIAFFVFTLGDVLDKNPRGKYLEILRLLLICGIASYAAFAGSPLFYILSAISGLSLLWFLQIQKSISDEIRD
ncbi:MAG: alkylglycerol monooxygenase [Flavobacteriales bacterium]